MPGALPTLVRILNPPTARIVVTQLTHIVCNATTVVRITRATLIVAIMVAVASEGRAEQLVRVRQIARGDFMAPRVGPGGQVIATESNYRGLFLFSTSATQTKPTVLSDAAEAGLHARWRSDGAILLRARHAGERIDLVIAGDRQARPVTLPAAVAFSRDDRIYVAAGDRGVVAIGTGDRFFGVTIAPDGDLVAFQGLTTGIYVYTRSTATLRRIGAGSAPAWSADGRSLVFERTEDDGHDIVASDLFRYDVATGIVHQLTATDDVIERRPSLAADGTIAFDDNHGGLLVGEVAP